MICSGCGRKIPDSAKFCKYCGAACDTQEKAHSEKHDGLPVKAQKYSRKKALVIVILIALFSGLAGTGIYFITAESSSDDLYQDNDTDLWEYINNSGEAIVKIASDARSDLKASLDVKQMISYKDALGPFYYTYEMQNDMDETYEYYCNIDITIPELGEDVKGCEAINRDITWMLSDYITLVEMIERGNYAMIEDNHSADIKVGYNLYEHNDTTALIIEYHWVPYAAGGDPSYMVYYYDHKGDKWIDYAEYAELNGYTVEDVFYEYKAETGNDYFSDASSLDNQGLIFFFNSRGELEFRESIL